MNAPAADEPEQWSSKDLVVAIPLVGTAIAISYDVGYFYGVDIAFFTLFSIAEHIVFALQAAPVALGLAVLLMLTVRSKLDVVAGQKIAALGRKSNIWVNLTVLAISGITVGLGIYYRLAGMAAGMLIGAFLTLTRFIPFEQRTVYSVSAILVIVSAFAMGHDNARAHLLSGEITHTIQTEKELAAMSVKIIRSGERGVLFYEPKTKQLGLVRWDAVKRLTGSW
ncbi:hypothetical protein [Bradyrhizobium sp. CCGB01]|uniref:hypothetical protein n=1 Tax=Bradyrhizobium sp. CCGB01 TaxID=2949634 RepID=UPI0020B3CA62|nr:hypothetical protein [Bradyrhizobium sp. CCGB01]MCP3408815.1 hypothetical protein [Bradyrhizobium sp. CCGB01]